jgi:hypothetical protein
VIIGYIDPGAGSLVIQAILAGALAIPFILRAQIGSAIRRLRGRRSDDAATRD